MSLRARLTLFIAATVGSAIAAVAFVAYGFAAEEARSEVDDFLRGRGPGSGLAVAAEVEDFRSRPGRGAGQGAGVFGPLDDIIREDAVAQFVEAGGAVITLGLSGVTLPVDSEDLAIAADGGAEYLRDETIAGVHYRMITRQLLPGIAIQIGRDVTATDQILSGLRWRLTILGAAGVALAAAVAWLVAARSLRPVAALTDAAERVAQTRRLEANIDIPDGGELGRLAAAFNQMLQALEEARSAQRRLVTDASHELRTPLTSIRTNIELLARGGVDGTDRDELLEDLTSEVAELSHLVSEIVDLATVGRDEGPFVEVDLRDLVEQAVERSRKRTDLEIVTDLDDTMVMGRPASLSRAVANLLDNALKWGEPGGQVEVTLRDGALAVRDHGPGIPEEDLPHVFRRFYRSSHARSTPGSGLGLAIVAAVAEDHGGAVEAVNEPAGGARVQLRLPFNRT